MGAPASRAARSAPGTPEAAARAAAPTPLRSVAAALAPFAARHRMVASAPRAHAHKNGVPASEGASSVPASAPPSEASTRIRTALAAFFEHVSVGGPSERALDAARWIAMTPSDFLASCLAPSFRSSRTAASLA